MHWLLLSLGIVLEVCGTTCLKLSDGFSKVVPSILIICFLWFIFCGYSLRYQTNGPEYRLCYLGNLGYHDRQYRRRHSLKRICKI